MKRALTIEEIIFDLIKPTHVDVTLDQLRKSGKEDTGMTSELKEIHDRVAKAGEGIRNAVATQVSKVFDRWSRPQEIRLRAGEMSAQEMRSVLACFGGVRASLNAELASFKPVASASEEFQPSLELYWAYEHALGFPSLRLGGRKERFARLWDDVSGVIIAEARFMRQSDREVVAYLSGVTGFCIPEIERKIVDQLFLDPELPDEFFGRLISELTAFINEGGKFSGSWGHVEVRSGRLVLVLPQASRTQYEISNSQVLKIDL